MATGEASKAANMHLGIPKAVFVEDVDSFMKGEEQAAEKVLRDFEDQHNKYKFMEYNLNTKKNRLKGQIPDIKTSLDIVKHLISKKESPGSLESRFLLSDQLYVTAKIPPTDRVCLWLGANVMLEYNLEDARNLLDKNFTTANKSLTQVDEDLGFLRDQTTTVEVNMARVYNWDVKRRQDSKSPKLI